MKRCIAWLNWLRNEDVDKLAGAMAEGIEPPPWLEDRPAEHELLQQRPWREGL